jgi:hypothetical protein
MAKTDTGRECCLGRPGGLEHVQIVLTVSLEHESGVTRTGAELAENFLDEFRDELEYLFLEKPTVPIVIGASKTPAGIYGIEGVEPSVHNCPVLLGQILRKDEDE